MAVVGRMEHEAGVAGYRTVASAFKASRPADLGVAVWAQQKT